MRTKNRLSMLLILSLLSCSTNVPIAKNNDSETKIVNLSHSNNINIDVGQDNKGASLSVNVLFNKFSTKANINGTPAKTPADIQSYEVYLIKNSASTYPSNGDPIGDKVAGPFIISNNGSSSRTITFTKIGDTLGKYCYVAVRAFDGVNAMGNSLIKSNPNWTGTTASITYNKQVAVSNGSGVSVSSDLVITPSSSLTITPDLLDGIPATLDTSISVNNGSLPASSFNGTNNFIGEFRVNTYTTNNQNSPSIASDSKGNFVIAWQSYNQDGNIGIYAQRYNVSGSPQGSEFRVNTYTTNNQNAPSIASDSKGSFVIAWGGSGVIRAKMYNNHGIIQGSEFIVSSYGGAQNFPSVISDPNGNFLITWQSDREVSHYGIYAQRYNSLGVPQGSEFRVNTYNINNQSNSSVTSDINGNFVITWQSEQDGSYHGIYAQRYNSLGVPQGSEFRVNTYTTNNQRYPSIASDINGNFVIAWQSGNFIIGREQDGSGNGIYAQRYNSLGIPQGSEFRVNTNTLRDQSYPSIASDINGNFVITWQSNQDGSGYGVYAQRYNSLGVPQGSEFRVNSYTNDNQNNPSITSDSNGDFVITWQSNQDGSSFGIYSQIYNNLGVAK
jgi:hypothetical protein